MEQAYTSAIQEGRLQDALSLRLRDQAGLAPRAPRASAVAALAARLAVERDVRPRTRSRAIQRALRLRLA
jgi:hypothetical protein